MCHFNTHKLISAQVRRSEQNTALNAKTEQFITAKISGNALKQWSKTHSVLRQSSSQLHKYKAFEKCSQTHSTLRWSSSQFKKNGCPNVSL